MYVCYLNINSSDESSWVENAAKSLGIIVKDYHIDGIDVYYEDIKPQAVHQFAKSIPKILKKLKNEDRAITEASITVPAPLHNNYYDLYRQGYKLFGHVVYQSHTEWSPISTFTDLASVFDKRSRDYPIEKIFAGHRDVRPADWTNVPPPIFLGAVPQLLGKGLLGISKWIVTPNDHNPEN